MGSFRKKHHKINIRTLAETVFSEGSLGMPAPPGISSRLGIEIHKKYQNRCIENYRSEVPLHAAFESDHVILEISGNADGIYPTDEGTHIEEIKTMRFGRNEKCEAVNAHLAQLKLYGLFYCREHDCKEVILDLIYYNRFSAEENIISGKFEKKALETECMEWINDYLGLIELNEQHKTRLTSGLENLVFPFQKFRKGQHEFSKSVYCAIREGEILFAEAPTGTGKTAAVLFPSLKALSEKHTDRIFYLTAKNSGAETAENTARLLKKQDLDLRWISVTAKSKICFTNGNDTEKPDCRPEKCPYSLDYYGRVRRVFRSVLAETSFNREKIEEIAEKYLLCPFELTLDIALFCDLVIADYNYAFDFSSRLKRFFGHGKTGFTFLVDEAHNIIDRTRAMYSSTISKSAVMRIKKNSPEPFKEVILALNSEFIKLRKKFGLPSLVRENDCPNSLIMTVQNCIDEFNLYIERKGRLPEDLSSFYMELLEFNTVSEHYSSSYRTLIKTSKQEVSVTLMCIDPSGEIEAVLSKQKSAVFFSATLTPFSYYKALTAPSFHEFFLKLPSPFDSENCIHLLKTDLSTRYRVRENNANEYVRTVKSIIENINGNIAVFSPSFAFQSMLTAGLGITDEKGNVTHTESSSMIIQSSQMTADEKVMFLDRFHTCRNLRAFCVSGGSFSESIDLPGEKLIGVIIFGVGLPQVNFENDTIKEFFDEKYGNGYAFTYAFPGFSRILQTAGRVIRTENDRGFVILIDDRYSSPEYRKLIPEHWITAKYSDNKSSLEIIREVLEQN